MLSVTPSGAVRGDIPLGAFLERHRLGGIELLLRPSCAPMLDRVNALMTKPTGVLRQRARLRQTVELERTEAHLVRTSVEHVAVNPRSPALGDLQVQTAAIGIHAGALRPRHLERRQPSRGPRHPFASCNHTHNHIADHSEGRRTVKNKRCTGSAWLTGLLVTVSE